MNKAKTTRNWTMVNLFIFIITLITNYLGASGFFNGKSQAEISDKYTTLITPAGFAFSIWGVIYTLLFISLIYLFIKRRDRNIGKLVEMISPLFIISSLLNMGWIVSFSYELIGLSTILIFGMMFSLLLIIEKIYKNRGSVPYLLVGTSFSLYGAWVFIASILNTAVFLVKIDWGGFGISDSIWTMIILLVAITAVLFYLSLYKNAIFPISLAWAFYGIYSSYSKGDLNPSMAPTIQALLLFGIGVFIISIIVTFIKNGNSIFPKKIS